MSLRTFMVLALFGLLLAIGVWLRQANLLTSESLSSLVDGLGPWALPGFLLLFMAGGLIPIPGMVFIIASRLVFGPTLGFVAAYSGALLAVSASFILVRGAMRGREREIRLPFRWAQRLLDGAENRPVLSVALLRVVFGISPPLNYGLGFTGLSTRHYIGGSAVGLVPPVAVVTFATGLFV